MGFVGAQATGPNITSVFVFSTAFHVLPPSVDITMPNSVMSTRVESSGATAYSMTMRLPFESLNRVRCHTLPFALTWWPVSMSPARNRPPCVIASAKGAIPMFATTSRNERPPSVER